MEFRDPCPDETSFPDPTGHLHERLGYVALATSKDDERMVLQLL